MGRVGGTCLAVPPRGSIAAICKAGVRPGSAARPLASPGCLCGALTKSAFFCLYLISATSLLQCRDLAMPLSPQE